MSTSLRGAPALVVALAFLTIGCVPTAAIEPDLPLTAAVQKGIQEGKAKFSHETFDSLLQKHVRKNGRVDYAALKKDHKKLETYLGQLANAKIETLARNELLALLINAYNAYTLDLIVRNYPLKSIKDISSPWDQKFCKVGGATVTLNDIEHKFLRPKELFNDPRMHFAINCASIGCPPLAAEAYVGSKIEAQLVAAVTAALKEPRYLKHEGGKVLLTKILDWFKADFVTVHGSLSKFLVEYTQGDVKKLLEEKGDAAIGFQSYDWSLNDVEKKPKK